MRRWRLRLLVLVLFPVVALPVADWWYHWFRDRYVLGVTLTQAGKEVCLPWRVYLIRRGDVSDLGFGSLVAFRPPVVSGEGEVKELGDYWGRIFGGRIVVKMVAGVPGGRLHVSKYGVSLSNGRFLDMLWLAEKWVDRSVLEKLDYSVLLREGEYEGEYFVVGTSKDAVDSRYLGPIKSDWIIGRAIPLL